MPPKKKTPKKRIGPGKVHMPSDDPLEDLLFVIEDAFELVDELDAELGHAQKQILALMKKEKKSQTSRGKLR